MVYHLKPEGTKLISPLFKMETKERRGSAKQRKFLRFLQRPFKYLVKARDFYIRSMIRCSAKLDSGVAVACPVGQVAAVLPRSYSVSSAISSRDGQDYSDLVRVASARSLEDGFRTSTVKERLFAAGTGKMGNCQASEAAAVVIHHPGNNVETLFQSVKAIEVMNVNAGHYMALKSENGTPLKQHKLLRPDDMLLVGNVYRLVSFEDVLKEFASKKTISLGELTKEKEDLDNLRMENSKSEDGEDDGGTSSRRSIHRGGHWKPSLQSIAEARA